MRERIVRVLRIISYSLAAFGAAWFGQPFENVATLSAARVPVQYSLRREHVCNHGGDNRAGQEPGDNEERRDPTLRHRAWATKENECGPEVQCDACNSTDDHRNDDARPRSFNFHWLHRKVACDHEAIAEFGLAGGHGWTTTSRIINLID